jgi:hypothetical protein
VVQLSSLPLLSGDFNSDGEFDAADYVLWWTSDDTLGVYNIWRQHFGTSAPSGAAAGQPAAVPKPVSRLLLLLVLASQVIVRFSQPD